MTAAARAGLVGSVLLAALLQVVDTTIANVALPTIRGALSATPSQAGWVITAYLVAAALATPATGCLAARWGRRRFLAGAIAGFLLASLACAAAPSLPVLVAARSVQGLCGAALVPLSQSLLLDAFPPNRHGQAMALWGLGIMVGPVLGPPLGGWLTETASWRWVFWINLPVGVVALAGVWAYVPDDPPQRRPFDARGLFFLAAAVAAFQLLLERWALLDGWSSAEIRVEASVAGLGLYLYLVHCRTRAHPFVRLGLLRDRNFGTACLFMATASALLYATLATLPGYLESVLAYPVATVGWVLAPRGLGTMVGMAAVGWFVDRRGDPRLAIGLGLVFIGVSLVQMAGFTPQEPMIGIVTSGVIQGLGIGLVGGPVSAAAYATLPAADRTEAAGLYSLVRNLGAGVGVAAAFAALERSVQRGHAELVMTLSPFRPSPFPTGTWPIALDQWALLDAEVTRQALTLAHTHLFALLALGAFVSLPAIAGFRPRPPVRSGA